MSCTLYDDLYSVYYKCCLEQEGPLRAGRKRCYFLKIKYCAYSTSVSDYYLWVSSNSLKMVSLSISSSLVSYLECCNMSDSISMPRSRSGFRVYLSTIIIHGVTSVFPGSIRIQIPTHVFHVQLQVEPLALVRALKMQMFQEMCGTRGLCSFGTTTAVHEHVNSNVILLYVDIFAGQCSE